MADLGNEYTLVELPAIEYLRDVLGYKDYVHGEKLIPAYGERESMRDVVLVSRLEKAVKRLNPWINETSLIKVKKIFTNSDNLGTSLL